MTESSHFDYIIIGNGLAGLQLALELSSDTHFDQKRIALIDPSEKLVNDKTWSFWETSSSKWDALVERQWSNAQVLTTNKSIQLDLNPYHYKTIKAIDFYRYAKDILLKKDNFSFFIEKVNHVTESDQITIVTDKNSYTSKHVFDSRIPSEFQKNDNNTISIVQHFKGWIIKTKAPSFDDKTITMMDYRLKDGAQTTFMYVLPFSKTEALVEFTYFTENVVDESVYDSHIKQYIQEFLQLSDYTIEDTEMGQIPMTNFAFDDYNTDGITKIGTAGGWVKPSSGYSFKHTEKKIKILIENIKSGDRPSKGLFKNKYKFYDKIFLKVLKDENHKGEWIFERFYEKNSVQTMFRFLDEDSSLLEELKIMASLFSMSFIKALFKTL